MKKKTITIQDVANHFGLVWLNGDFNSMKREVVEINVNRPGLELAGFFDSPRSKRIIVIGNKETLYIKTMSDAKIKKAFEFLFVECCPGCIITADNEVDPRILNIAKQTNFPMFRSNRKTNDLNIDMITYLSEELAPSTSLHGTLVEIYSTGVIITGESGIGKSETALELLKKNHHLVSDDRVDISLVRNKLIGRAPELLTNMIEVRGIGIIDVSKMFGINSVIESKEVDLVIKLVTLDAQQEMERLGTNQKYVDILGQKVPEITLPVSGARAVGDIIETAVTNYKLKKRGYDSTYIFEERLNELLRKRSS